MSTFFEWVNMLFEFISVHGSTIVGVVTAISLLFVVATTMFKRSPGRSSAWVSLLSGIVSAVLRVHLACRGFSMKTY